MPARKITAQKLYPYELVLRAHGPAELLDSDDNQLWSSDSDDDFRDEFSDEFLQEEDIPDILDYLADHGYLNEEEFAALSSDRWDCSVETLESSAGGGDLTDDDDLDGDFDEDD
jgi:hypothetical protein